MEIVLMNDNAIIPTRASKESAGLDLYSSIDVDIEVGSIKKVNTGICISLPENSYGSIRDKSSLAIKGILTLDGVTDKDYMGEIIVIMTSLIEPIKIKKGQKEAQLIVSNISYPEIKKVKHLKETEKNNKGFGEMGLRSKELLSQIIIDTMSNDFIEMINDIDLLYGFIYECTNLVNNLYDHNIYDHLAIKLYSNFVLPLIDITKSEHIKEYNEHVENNKCINRNCSYLINICFERYFDYRKMNILK